MDNNDYITARLADGTSLRFPKGTRPEVIEKVAKDQSIARRLNEIEVPEDLPWYEDAYEWTKKNLDIPAGLAGAVAGAKYGAVGGPKGIVLGGIIGGATGTFGGSIASDVYRMYLLIMLMP